MLMKLFFTDNKMDILKDHMNDDNKMNNNNNNNNIKSGNKHQPFFRYKNKSMNFE